MLDVAILTVNRPSFGSVNYIHQTLASLFMSDKYLYENTNIRLMVGSPDTEYLDAYKHHKKITIDPMPDQEWERIKDKGVHYKLICNFYRSFLFEPSPNSIGRVFLEDDVILADRWVEYLVQFILPNIHANFGKKFGLGIYTPGGITDIAKGVYKISSQFYYGAQGLYVPNELLYEIGEFIRTETYEKEFGVDPTALPSDLTFNKYFYTNDVPFLIEMPSCVDHIGKISNGLGAFHKAANFGNLFD